MKYILYTFLLFCCFTVHASNYGDAECELLYVIDGDTIKCNLKGYPDIIGREIPVRFRGVDAPEMRGDERPLGIISKAKVEKLLRDKKVTLKNMDRDKYFRIDADIYADSVMINTAEKIMP